MLAGAVIMSTCQLAEGCVSVVSIRIRPTPYRVCTDTSLFWQSVGLELTHTEPAKGVDLGLQSRTTVIGHIWTVRAC